MKQIIALLLAVCMTFTQLPFVSAAPETLDSGTCGDGLTWTLTEEGVLTISGNGIIPGYSRTQSPWHTQRDKVLRIIIENGVTAIGNSAFGDCYNATNITLPESLITIGVSAFASCPKLTSIYIPDSVTSIGERAFYYCASLTEVRLSANIDAIHNQTFAYCQKLAGVEIPEGVTAIGAEAFFSCNSLADISLPSSLTSLDRAAFDGCSSLAEITIPNSVVTIGIGTFNDCTSLTSITIPSGVASIGYGAFDSCSKLVEIIVDAENPYYSSDDRGVLFDKDKTVLLQAPGAISGKYEIPNTVITIGSAAFHTCNNLTSVTIPNGVITIEADAFRSCGNLGKIAIPDSVIKVGNSAFRFCSNLGSAVLGNGVTTIDNNAFYGCYNLRYVIFGESVASLGDTVFSRCSNLKALLFYGGAPSMLSYTLFSVKAVAFYSDDNPSWTADKLQNYGGSIVWIPFNKTGMTETIVVDRQDVEPDDSPDHPDGGHTVNGQILVRPKVLDGDVADFALSLFHSGSLSEVAVSSALGKATITNNMFEISSADAAKQDIILTKSGFRDYILPASVAASFINSAREQYSLTAWMQHDRNDGKPYISTVFGRESNSGNPYIDMRQAELTVVKDKRQDIIITAAGFGDQEVTYYLAQDGDRRLQSSNGIFTEVDLYQRMNGFSTLYAYAIASDGTVTPPQEIKIDRVDLDRINADLNSLVEFSLFGEKTQKFKIPDSIPLLRNAIVNVDAFKIPVGISFENGRIRVTLGVDFYGNDYDGKKSDTKVLYKNFTDMILNADEYLEKIDDTNKAFAAVVNNWKEFGKKLKEEDNNFKNLDTEKPKEGAFSVSLIGYLEAGYANNQIVISDSKLVFTMNTKLKWGLQSNIGPVPVYGAIDIEGTGAVGGKITRFLPDQNIPFDIRAIVEIKPDVTGALGVGIDDIAALGLYANATLPILMEWLEYPVRHFLVEFDGEIGVEGDLFVLHSKKRIFPTEEGAWKTTLIDRYLDTPYRSTALLHKPKLPYEFVTVTSVAPRDYSLKTSQWLSGGRGLMSTNNADTDLGVSFQNLQTDIFRNSQPTLVVVDNKMLMVWSEDDLTRDAYSRMRLVYSVYDPNLGYWSAPSPVWDDGFNDGYPRLVSDGENAYVLWQKVNTSLMEENTDSFDAILENTELCLAKFDPANNRFTDVQMLTTNDLYEYSHNVVLANGQPVVYWAAADENALNESGTSSLYCYSNGHAVKIAQNLNYILSVDADASETVYVMDSDGDLTSVADVTAFILTGSETTAVDNSEIASAITYAKYGTMNGKKQLFFSDMSNIYYEQDGEMKSIFAYPRSISGNLNIIGSASGTTVLWTEASTGNNELYMCSYSDGKWSEPVCISKFGKLLSDVCAVEYDGKLTGICNATTITYDEANDKYTQAGTDLVQFRVNDFTDIGIDAYLYVDEQQLEKNAETEFSVSVCNNGTTAINEVTFILTDTLGTEITQTMDLQIPAGSSTDVSLRYFVPENYTTTTLTITAKTNEVDANESNNTVALYLGNHDLIVTETAVEHLDSGYLLKSLVENFSLVDANNVVLTICADAEGTNVLQTAKIGTIHRGNYALAETLLLSNALDFDENGIAMVYLHVSADGVESASVDNSCCFIITQVAETICMHPVTEINDGKEATCTEKGYEPYETCIACGQVVGDVIEIPIQDHHYSMTETEEPSCSGNGYRCYACIDCGCSYTETINALGHDWEDLVCRRCGESRQNPFADADPGSFYFDAMIWAAENGITNGTTPTTFSPNDQCMRAHVVTFLWRAMGSPEPKLMVNPFVDVKPTDFYYKPVLWALENGITSGMDATHFGTTSYCNRAQVVTFLYRTMGSPDVGVAANPFTDVAAGSFYEKPVLWAVENGVTAGLSATSFGPNSICNRAQIVTFLYRAFN